MTKIVGCESAREGWFQKWHSNYVSNNNCPDYIILIFMSKMNEYNAKTKEIIKQYNEFTWLYILQCQTFATNVSENIQSASLL